MDFGSQCDDLVFAYRQCPKRIAHWRAVLPPNRFLDVEYEALVADPDAGARRLIAFTGLDWDPACLHPEDNARTVATARACLLYVETVMLQFPWFESAIHAFRRFRLKRSRSSMWQARQPGDTGWRHYESWLSELRDLLPA